ncbi:hypothetical protein POTOM_017561 [Populus tomentosa]|uniref:Protein kinase domain-containing protein n=1 Tax=Populus tomentosa TaxID=118781 RepID=A0A8X8A0E8_POPTO|nr:hypothetical protein POTOM_017561 [Populus tomentosa]
MIFFKMRLCNTGRCPCPPNFHGDPFSKGGSTPRDASLALSSGCKSRTEFDSSVFYVKLGNGMDFFANALMAPAKRDTSLLACQDLRLRNCSCLGILYGNSSGSCYVLGNPLGSITAVFYSNRDRLGNKKTLVVSSMANPDANNQDEAKKFAIAGLVLLPSFGIVLIIVIALGFIYWRRNRLSGTASHGDSSLPDLEIISIPGLPVMFNYEDLVAATENFRAQIGSGGFGTVYKGTLPDKTFVTVKKITNVGFCTQGRQRFLIYEYMNEGKKGLKPLSEERGLAYLRSSSAKPRTVQSLHSNERDTRLPCEHSIQALQATKREQLPKQRKSLGSPEWPTGITISDKVDAWNLGLHIPPYLMHQKGRYLELADSRLERRVTNEEVEKLVKVPLCCTHEDPKLRPNMVNVVGMLEV